VLLSFEHPTNTDRTAIIVSRIVRLRISDSFLGCVKEPSGHRHHALHGPSGMVNVTLFSPGNTEVLDTGQVGRLRVERDAV
jgi:hypothetical protein